MPSGSNPDDNGEGTSPPKGPGGGLNGGTLDAGAPAPKDDASIPSDAGVDGAALDLTWLDASTSPCAVEPDGGSFHAYLRFLDVRSCAQ